jgi:hypothetical protein
LFDKKTNGNNNVWVALMFSNDTFRILATGSIVVYGYMKYFKK